MLPAMGGMARVEVTPDRVGILDFEAALPERGRRAVAAATA